MTPPQLFTIADIRNAGTANMDPKWAQYLNEGAMDLVTLKSNEAAFERYRIMPRILRDVATVDMSTTLFGSKVSMPLGFSPAAMHCLAHPDGEVATSGAAAKAGIAMALSNWSTKSLEDVIAAGNEVGNGTPYAVQTSTGTPKPSIEELIRRADEAGYSAVLLTVDAPALGRRLNEYRNGVELPTGMKFPNISFDPSSFRGIKRDAASTFETFLPWIASLVPPHMELWLKGIYTPEDVRIAATYPFIRGIIISNHGGRQLDGAPATLEALPDCAAAVKSVNLSRSPENKLRIAIDGGIRRGSDIFKCLALGADFCFVGRLAMWGLAYDGQRGVERALTLLNEELETCMKLAGCKTLADIGPESLAVVEGGVPGLIHRLERL
ncbi:hypothetical protein PENANT_c008G03784 [Penicillium antarcticum]|uniref:FMN hydroxy acid dehydrogenase domain-containing protein n=1 Tax=Penicillium antarcticum TaxID=416450 RepID=A0A1V6QAG3_9EURO|nr:FMN-dependent dehydrogenase family protein [Penicillium antarcticum]KAJ5302190.1 FMN-dependent dehydrogenase family protein [Penicillium antarcticum]OQD86221.1 hypothetical protein PENANT_c008G03784 [Penicillium antarcticum]